MSTTTLTQKYNPSDTSIVVADSTVLNPAPDTLKITDSLGRYVALKYTKVTGNTISGLSIINGNGTISFESGSNVTDSLDKYRSIPALSEAVENLEKAGGGGGTNNYNLLLNKPKINNKELLGNVSPEDIGVVEYSTRSTAHPSAKLGIEVENNRIYLEI